MPDILNQPKTRLSPLEEALFRTWAAAQGVDNHNDLDNRFDHRGLYKQSNGAILPMDIVNQMAESHNKATEPQEDQQGSTEFPDPYAAQAEMHGNTLKAQTDREKIQAQATLEDKKHSQKLELEQMKLAHTSAEKDKDRQHKAQEQAQVRAQAQEDAERNRQLQAQQTAEDRQFQASQSAQDRQYQVQDAQENRQNGLHDTLLQEHLSRSRPQPAPQGGLGSPQNGSNQPPAPSPPGQVQGAPTAPQQAQQGGNPLQDQLMQRAMR